MSYTKLQKQINKKKSFDNFIINCFRSVESFNDFAEAAKLSSTSSLCKLFNHPDTVIFRDRVVNHNTNAFHKELFSVSLLKSNETFIEKICLPAFTHYDLPIEIHGTISYNAKGSYTVLYSIINLKSFPFKLSNHPEEVKNIFSFTQRISAEVQEQINNYNILT